MTFVFLGVDALKKKTNWIFRTKINSAKAFLWVGMDFRDLFVSAYSRLDYNLTILQGYFLFSILVLLIQSS
jgi:hypothetical protein